MTPGAVALRANTCQRVVDVVIGALAHVLPTQAIGAANGANTSIVLAGTNPETGEPYVYLETLGGGMGGRSDRDGKDGVQVHITNTSNLPIESIEMEDPLYVVAYGLVEDSGGAGRYRGGMGLRRVVKPGTPVRWASDSVMHRGAFSAVHLASPVVSASKQRMGKPSGSHPKPAGAH